MNNYYVYEIINPVDNRVFYVGKGIRKRYLQHYKDVVKHRIANDSNFYLTFEILYIIQQGLQPVYEFPVSNVEELEAYAWEAAYIDYYGLSNLCNRCPGGEVYNPMKGKHHTEETKKKIQSINRMWTIRNQCGGFVNYFEKLYNKQNKVSIPRPVKYEDMPKQTNILTSGNIDWLKQTISKIDWRELVKRRKCA